MFKISLIELAQLLAYAIVMGASQIIMSKASKQIGGNIGEAGLFSAIFTSSWLFFALLFYVIATGIWLIILFRVDIRIAYPVASTSIIFASILQSYLDNKFPPTSYWLGIITVLTGIALINQSSR
jgi:drug/metabolite transporter (DMT)-like permease